MKLEKPKHANYGLMAEFHTPEEVLEAAKKTYAEGYRRFNAYSPYPVEGLAEACGFHHSKLPLIVLAGGIVGCVGGFALQYWGSVHYYPMNIGGKPLNSWPAFIPITFETTVLCAAFAAVLGMLALNKLPMPYHPVFNVPEFTQASRDKFFLAIEASDPKYDAVKTQEFLKGLSQYGVYEVDR